MKTNLKFAVCHLRLEIVLATSSTYRLTEKTGSKMVWAGTEMQNLRDTQQ
jgi:hypothetical protein